MQPNIHFFVNSNVLCCWFSHTLSEEQFFSHKKVRNTPKCELEHQSLFIFHGFQGKSKKFDFLKKGPKTDFNFCCMLLASSNTVRNHHPFDWSQKINLNFVQDQCAKSKLNTKKGLHTHPTHPTTNFLRVLDLIVN